MRALHPLPVSLPTSGAKQSCHARGSRTCAPVQSFFRSQEDVPTQLLMESDGSHLLREGAQRRTFWRENGPTTFKNGSETQFSRLRVPEIEREGGQKVGHTPSDGPINCTRKHARTCPSHAVTHVACTCVAREDKTQGRRLFSPPLVPARSAVRPEPSSVCLFVVLTRGCSMLSPGGG